MDGLLSQSRVLNSSIFGAGGKNPMEDWLNPTSKYAEVDPNIDIATSLVGSVTGSGWIVFIGTESTPNDIALHIDGSAYLGNHSTDKFVEINRGVLTMIRYESGFAFYSDGGAGTNLLVYIEGDEFEKGELKLFIDYPSLSTNTTVLNVTGEGWFHGGYNRGNGMSLDIDGVNLFTNKRMAQFAALVKFNSSLKIDVQLNARQWFTYTLL